MTEKTLLFVHQGALGDFVVTFPVLRALHSGFARIDGICRAEFGKLAQHLAVIDAFYPQDAARFASLYSADMDPRVIEVLQTYDCILLFSFSETLEESVRRVAADTVCRIAPWPREETGIHVTDFLFRKLQDKQLLPESESTSDPAPRSPRNPAGWRGKCRSGSRIILSPGAGSHAKRWPLAGYLRLADMLAANGFSPEFVLGPAERELESLISAESPPVAAVHRGLGLVQLSDLLQSAAGYVGNDSAVSHLAAFLQIPSVVIFGPSNAGRWRPIGPFVSVLQVDMPPGPGDNGKKAGRNERIWLKRLPPALVLTSIFDLTKP